MVSLASSCVFIELDTTSPQIAIYAPRYTTQDIVNEIVIEANEALADYQDVYAVDSGGVRHEYTFEQAQPQQFVGLIRFNDFPLGIATIYARLKDDVDNYSETVSATLLVKESTPSLNLEISDRHRSITADSLIRMQGVSDKIRSTRTDDKMKRHITLNDRKRTVDMRE